MSTLGDPLTDLGTFLAYWSEASDAAVLAAARVMAPVTAADGFPTRAEIVRRYATRTGFDVSDVEWYQAFAFFKLAVVCQGIAARAAGGAMLGSGFDEAQRLVAPLVDAGRLGALLLQLSPSFAPGRHELDELVPLLDRHGVRLGVQNHNGRYVANASGLRELLRGYEPRHVCAVWDAAHNALQGEEPELAIDIVWSQLGMVNLKNALWRRTTGPEAEVVQWKPYWTSGRQGLASWPRVASELVRRGYKGTLCLTAEYSDEGAVERLVKEDLAFARGLFEG
jgi:hypothetical protein